MSQRRKTSGSSTAKMQRPPLCRKMESWTMERLLGNVRCWYSNASIGMHSGTEFKVDDARCRRGVCSATGFKDDGILQKTDLFNEFES